MKSKVCKRLSRILIIESLQYKNLPTSVNLYSTERNSSSFADKTEGSPLCMNDFLETNL